MELQGGFFLRAEEEDHSLLSRISFPKLLSVKTLLKEESSLLSFFFSGKDLGMGVPRGAPPFWRKEGSGSNMLFRIQRNFAFPVTFFEKDVLYSSELLLKLEERGFFRKNVGTKFRESR